MLDRATTPDDLDVAEMARDAVTDAAVKLGTSPFPYRKADSGPFVRGLIIPFGSSGYVMLFEIDDAKTVSILAVRHRMEDDFH